MLSRARGKLTAGCLAASDRAADFGEVDAEDVVQ
jgi:hypothetical protein